MSSFFGMLARRRPSVAAAAGTVTIAPAPVTVQLQTGDPVWTIPALPSRVPPATIQAAMGTRTTAYTRCAAATGPSVPWQWRTFFPPSGTWAIAKQFILEKLSPASDWAQGDWTLIMAVKLLPFGDGVAPEDFFGSEPDITLGRGARGEYDQHWIDIADACTVLSDDQLDRLILRVAHEANSPAQPDRFVPRTASGSTSATALDAYRIDDLAAPVAYSRPALIRDFKAYWRRVHGIFATRFALAGRSEDFQRILWDWCVLPASSGALLAPGAVGNPYPDRWYQNLLEDAFPGADVVDMITIDDYSMNDGDDWTGGRRGRYQWMIDFAEVHNLMIGVDEFNVGVLADFGTLDYRLAGPWTPGVAVSTSQVWYHDGRYWRSTTAGNTTTPGGANWVRVLNGRDAGGITDTVNAWSSARTYLAGELVTSGGQTYISLAGGNTNRAVTLTAWWWPFYDGETATKAADDVAWLDARMDLLQSRIGATSGALHHICLYETDIVPQQLWACMFAPSVFIRPGFRGTVIAGTSINSSFPLAGRRLLDRLGITAGPTDTMLTSVATTTEIAAAQARYAAATAPTKAEGDRIIAAAAPFLTSTQLLTVTADGNGHAFIGAGGYTGSANVDYLAALTLQQHALGLAHSWLATGTASYADKLISRAMAWGVDPATKWDGAVPLPYTTPLTHLVTQTITQFHDAVAAVWGYSGWTPAQRAGWRTYITGVVANWQDHIAYAAPPSTQWPEGQIHNMEMTRVAFLLSCAPWLDGAAKTALVAKMADRYKAVLTQNVRVVAGSPTQYRWRLEAVHPSGHTLGYHVLITNEAVSVLRRLENLGGGDLWAWSPGTTPAYSFLNVLDWLMTVLDRPTAQVTPYWLSLLPAMVLKDEWPAPIGALISKDWSSDTRRDLGFLHLVRAKYTSGARHTLAGSVLARNHAGTLDWHNRACGCARFIWGTV